MIRKNSEFRIQNSEGTTILRVIATVLVVCFLLAALGCNKTDRTAKSQSLDLLCTFLPVYIMTQNITAGAQNLTVHNLLPASVGCPHNYALTPTDATLLSQANVLIMNGLGMEAFLEGTPYLQRQDLSVIRAGNAVEPIEIATTAVHGDHQHTAASSSPQLNPHAWVSPQAAAQMTRFIASRLAEKDPSQAELFKHNAELYATRLDSIGKAIKAFVLEVRNQRIVTQHEAFDYLARDVDLDIVAVIEPEPGTEPSARYLANLIQTIRESQPVGIFVEPQYSDRLGKMLSKESGIPLYTLDSAVSGAEDAEAYIRVMSNNLEVLKKAMQVADKR